MSKPKINPEVAVEQQKELLRQDIQGCIHSLLYTEDEAGSHPHMERFRMFADKSITTSEIINYFAKELRKEVE